MSNPLKRQKIFVYTVRNLWSAEKGPLAAARIWEERVFLKTLPNETLKGFHSHPVSLAFATPCGGHGVGATPGDDLHWLVVKGFSNCPSLHKRQYATSSQNMQAFF
jgi:hypothetical protein